MADRAAGRRAGRRHTAGGLGQGAAGPAGTAARRPGGGARGFAASALRIHFDLAQVYREKVAGLAEVLARADNTVARKTVRSLIEVTVLVPEDGRLRVEVRGERTAILSLCAADRQRQACVSAESDAAGLALHTKRVAGAGFEPAAFRL